MKLRAWPVLVAVIACSPELPTGETPITCRDDGDCPTGRCELTIARCVGAGSGTALRLNSAVAASSVRVDAIFNQAVAPGSVLDVSQVRITPPLEVMGMALDASNQRLSVTTAPQAFDVIYTVTVDGFVGNLGDALDTGARSASFSSYLGLAERSPPAIVRPASGALVIGGDVELVWQAVSNATRYTVEVWELGGSAPVISTEVQAPASSTTVTLAAEGTYEWRVRADLTTDGVYSSATFDTVVEAIYVACPSGDCLPREGNGSRRFPVQRIAEGVTLAARLGVPVVRVAERTDGSPYAESLVLADAGVTLDGGFDTSFVPDTGRATLEGVGTVIVARPTPTPLRLERLTLSALAAPSMEVVAVDGPVDVTLRDVVLLAEPPIDTSIGVNCDGRPGRASVQLDDVVMQLAGTNTAGAAQTLLLAGVRARDTQLVATGSVLAVGIAPSPIGPDVVHGIALEGESALTASRLDVGVGYAMLDAAALHDGRTGRPADAPAFDVVDASRLWATSGNSSVTGVYVGRLRELVVRNSVIVAGSGAIVNAVLIERDLAAGNGPRFVHDVMQVGSDRPSTAITSNTKGYIVASSTLITAPCTSPSCGGVKNACVFANGDVGPAMLAGCALLCEQAYLGVGMGSPNFAQPSPACADAQGRVIRCGGTTHIPGAVTAYFADVDGADASVARARDNDYHLVAAAPAALRNGGADLSSSSCGYGDQSLACVAGATDADGATRTSPFSMGPYEY